jgi:hypothetical protein
MSELMFIQNILGCIMEKTKYRLSSAVGCPHGSPVIVVVVCSGLNSRPTLSASDDGALWNHSHLGGVLVENGFPFNPVGHVFSVKTQILLARSDVFDVVSSLEASSWRWTWFACVATLFSVGCWRPYVWSARERRGLSVALCRFPCVWQGQTRFSSGSGFSLCRRCFDGCSV